MKLRFLCIGGSKMQSMSLLGGLRACSPRIFLKNACFEIESGAFWGTTQNCCAKDRLWKSTVREISLVVHATFCIFEIKCLGRVKSPP